MQKNIFAALLASLLLGVQAVMAMDIPDAGSPGAKLYATRCTVCHALPHPKRLDWIAWRHMLHVMKRRMQERGVRMEPDEWHRIAAYLKQHAR